jgi:xanthine dehydrogenase accessory factor
MSDETSVLVFGMDELASAIARKLHLAGYAVAVHQPSPPLTIRRRMAFADAWFEGSCTFEGVEARRADKTKDFLAGLRSGMFVPILWHPFEDVTTRWPWDVLVDARPAASKTRPHLRSLAELSIGLGSGFTAGENCDIVVDINGNDPGAILRSGSVAARDPTDEMSFGGGTLIHAPHHGLFNGTKLLGEPVEDGAIIGWIGTTSISTPRGGRLRGIARDGAAVPKGAEIAEIVPASGVECVGITKRDRLIARSVAFVIEMEREGWAPISLENLF